MREPEPGLRWGYRDKVCLAGAYRDEQWHFGLLHRDELIPIPHCPIHSPRVRATLNLLAPRLPPPPDFPLKWLVQAGGQVTLVLKTHHEPPRGWLSGPLWEALRGAGVEGMWLNLFPAAGRNRFTKRGWRLLAGQSRSLALAHDDVESLVHGPEAFAQLIPSLYGQAVRRGAAYLAPNAHSTVVDLYSGIGATLRTWRRAGATVVGVECNAEAVACAARNAPGVHLLHGRCSHRLPQLTEFINEHPHRRQLAWVNPPRTGLEREVAAWLGAQGDLDRLAYLSCSAGTLGRDLELLCARGFRVDALVPYDFFPQTKHVETLALLRR